MRVFVTGGTGFTGSHLVQRLVKRLMHLLRKDHIFMLMGVPIGMWVFRKHWTDGVILRTAGIYGTRDPKLSKFFKSVKMTIIIIFNKRII
jgi:nucleoside-diphosphate-sugar epimerase